MQLIITPQTRLYKGALRPVFDIVQWGNHYTENRIVETYFTMTDALAAKKRLEAPANT